MNNLKPKRILFVHYSIYSQKRWGRIFPLAKGAAKCGYNVTLLTTSPKKGVIYNTKFLDNVKIIMFRDIIPKFFLKKGFVFISFITRCFYVLLHNYDYVFSDCGECINTGWICKIAQWKGAIYISEWGDLLGKGGYYDYKPKWFKVIYGRYFLWAELYFRKSANYTVVLSSMMKQHAINKGISKEKIIIVPGGAVSDIITHAYSDKSQLEIPENIITLGYIGIDNGELQDLRPLIQALHDPLLEGRFKLIVFGKKINKKYIEELNLSDIILEKGWIDYYKDPSPLQCVDIYVLMKSDNIYLSSLGWPNKLGDYMAIGRPVLITPYGDVSQFIKENPDGFITIDTEPRNITNCLYSILNNKYNLKQMGLYNRKVAIEKISWEARIKLLMHQVR
jgi:glycosyltransferase involved in cell wall biosynthesis